MKKVFSFGLLIAAMVLVTFSSCKPANTVKNVTGVKLSETTKSIVVGGEFVLTATVSPNDAVNKEVTWASDKADIATVNNNGKVKGLAIGEATITVTTKEGNKTDKCKVTVDAEAEKATLFGNVYYLEDEIPNAYPYVIKLITPADAFVDGKIKSAGTFHIFTILSTKPANETDVPASGKYTAKGGSEPMTLMIDPKRSYVYNFTAQGKMDGKIKPITSGNFYVADKKFAFYGATSEGKIGIAYNGDCKVVNGGPWIREPKTQETKNETFTTGNITSYGDDNGKLPSQNLYLTSKENGKVLVADFFVAKDATTFTPGVYNVTSTKAIGTIRKSPGGKVAGLGAMSSIFAILDGELVKTIYFFDRGQAVVTDKNIDFTITSHFGSTLNIKYTGPMDFKKSGTPPKPYHL